jgi:acyl carrier protein
MNEEQTRTAIRQVLSAHAKLSVDVSTLPDDADLFAAGMSSFASVNVMLALEDSFDIEFPNTMLSRRVFESIDSIATAIESIASPV